jgi:hypothetical protein
MPRTPPEFRLALSLPRVPPVSSSSD